MELPLHFPRLRPAGEPFAAWADEVAARGLGDPPVAEGIARIDAEERAGIEGAHAKEFPDVWQSFCADLGGDEEMARRAVLAGAVAAAVKERQPPDPDRLALLEDSGDLCRDAGETLAFLLEAGDLWSIAESAQVEERLRAIPDDLDDDAYEPEWYGVVAREAERLMTPWHEERLALLVRRLRAQLPLAGFPAASTALEEACAAFERDAGLRRRLAELLVIDAFSRLPLDLPLAA
jgi:hypothetical protein